MPLNGEELRTAMAARRKTVDVAVGVGSLRLRALSAGDLVRLNHQKHKALLAETDPEEVAFEYIARSWVNAENELLFTVEEGISAAKLLDQADYKVIAKAIAVLNGIDAQAVEDAAKN